MTGKDAFLVSETFLKDCVSSLKTLSDTSGEIVNDMKFVTKKCLEMKENLKFTKTFELLTTSELESIQHVTYERLAPIMNYVSNTIESHLGELEESRKKFSAEIERHESLMKSARNGHLIDKTRLQELKKEHAHLVETLESLEGRLEEEKSKLAGFENQDISIEFRNLQQKKQCLTDLMETLQEKNSELDEVVSQKRERLKQLEKEEEDEQIQSHDSNSSEQSSHVNPELEERQNRSQIFKYRQMIEILRDIDLRYDDETENVRDLTENLKDELIQEESRLKLLTDKLSRDILPQKMKSFQLARLQISNLFKLLYPHQNIGLTLAKISQLLLSSTDFRMNYADLLKEFPSQEEARHHFQESIQILIHMGIITKSPKTIENSEDPTKSCEEWVALVLESS